MPTYAMDAGFFEEYDIPIDGEEFTTAPNGMQVSKFSGETVTFKVEDLDAQTQLVFGALKEAGITSIYCTYDGSSDEGFAHFKSATIGEHAKTLEEITPLLSHLETIPAEKGFGEGSVLFMNCYYSRDIFEAMTPEQRVKDALDFFAYALGSQLLGSGFGTGVEGVMYGAFRANLISGEIVDEYADAPEGTFDPYED